VTCYVSPIKALPTAKTKIERPAVTIGGRTITFPVAIESGCYLEFNSLADCKLFGANGNVIQEVKPEGETPVLKAGDNQVVFTCRRPEGLNPRAEITVISQGEPLRQ
jgi:hypothetical protein